MSRAGLPRLGALLAVLVTWSAPLAAVAAPDEPAASGAPPADAAQAGDRPRASELFEAARRAFDAGDFLAAAQGFEAAYAAAPHPAALWNAAQSWHRAGDLLRAASLYQRYLREAPPGAVDRDAALADLEVLKPSLGRIAVVAPGATDVTVDGRALEDDYAWVLPGAHLVEGRFHGTPARIKADVAAGAVLSVALVAAGVAAHPAPAPAPKLRALREGTNAREPERAGWPAWAITPFAGATLIAAGGLLASGIDTENLHDEFKGSGDRDRYAFDNGNFAMDRTNVLVAVTAGVGAVTLGVALFAIDWNGEAPGGEIVGAATPAGASARGAF